jgi:flagellar hook-length control protein FliK
MNCADVMSLARAAPEPASSTRAYARDDGNSFDQFLEAVTSDRPTSKEESTKTVSSNREDIKDDQNHIDTEPKDQKQVNEKPVAKKESQEPADKVDENVKEIIAAAMAAQVLNVVTPVVKPEEPAQKAVSTEVTVPAAVVPVQQNIQPAVIQLPDTEPQPLPDELKEAVQQPKVEVKDFQTIVDAAAKNLENQAVQSGQTAVETKPVMEVKALDAKETAVKVVDIKAQPEDVAAMDSSRNTGGLYAMAAVKTENLIQPKTLPMIREISQEVANLAREQGQSLRIQVHPENMGKIDLRLISNSDGLRVVMTAEIPATAKLLENHMNQLQHSLAEAGLSVSGMSVNSQGAQGQSANQFQQGLVRTSPSVFLNEPETITPEVIQTASSGLDYRV